MKKFMLLPIAAMAAACDKTPPDVSMSKELFEYKVAQIENQIDEMPDWYTDIPKEDAPMPPMPDMGGMGGMGGMM